jgi:hypothetical protein
MNVNLVDASQFTTSDPCALCRVPYDILSKTRQFIVTNCMHVFDTECYELIKRKQTASSGRPLCPCDQEITGIAPFVILNHAVALDYRERCSDCSQTFEELVRDGKELVVTDCGHLFDRACVDRRVDEARAQRRKWSCFCGKEVIVCDTHAYNPDRCAECKEPFMESSTFTQTIANCGHVFHNVCHAQRQLANKSPCPACKSPVFARVVYPCLPQGLEPRRDSREEAGFAIPRSETPEPERQLTATSAPERMLSPPPLLDLRQREMAGSVIPVQQIPTRTPSPLTSERHDELIDDFTLI